MPRWIAPRLWSFSGTVGRRTFVIAGILLFAAKYTLDWTVATGAYGRPWPLRTYLVQTQASMMLHGTVRDGAFFATMLLVAVPFIWAGLSLTVRRLRDAGAPVWLSLLFFAPFVNYVLFAVLALVAARSRRREPDEGDGALLGRAIPQGGATSAAFAVALSFLLGLLLVAFNIYALRVYGIGLFVGLPTCIGMITALIHEFHAPRTQGSSVALALAAVGLIAVAMLILMMEGAACIIMAAPIWVAMAALGACLGHIIAVHSRDQREAAILVGGLALLIPAMMGAEYALRATPPRIAVRTAVEVPAPPERVWPRVVEFPDLAPPTELVFRAGVAFPTGAVIDGEGPGAVRRCVFSTGEFVEPIEVWDPPRELRFAVTSNPQPMREWSFYDSVDPPHLHGYMVSRAGQFLLTPLPQGKTLLQGTTWYENAMWPGEYWRLWSDYLIGRIHRRVLDHVSAMASQAQHPEAVSWNRTR